MPVSPAIDVTLTGQSGAEVSVAAERIALALMAAGAQVECAGHRNPARDTMASLGGVLVRVRVAEDALPAAALPEAVTQGKQGVNIWRIALAVLVLLALLDAEVRLRFGLKLDAILLAAVAWGVWHWTGGSRRG
jgi:hypothetical protein